MAITRKRARTLDISVNPNPQINGDKPTQIQKNETQNISGYEQFREERIKENLERMQKLGILDLSLKLKSLKPTPKNSPSNRRITQIVSPLPQSGPVRRSSRLHNVTPVSYSEVQLAKKDTAFEGELLREGLKPEVYTEEHEKLLGDTKMSWTLFMDGYGNDGKRIYDSIKGKTCHQCRQKTLGHRTHCSKCEMVQGQFCGDCLYMRYGENVLEAKQNSNWICPPCRGICNCSLCRQAKGWAPTGILYKRISNLGFKSVAHYLIQTHRSNTDLEKNSGSKVPVSAKRSLPFSDMEATSEKESPDPNIHGLVEPEYEDNKTNDDFKGEKNKVMKISDKEHGDSNAAPESSPEPVKNHALGIESSDDSQGLTDNWFKGKKEEILQFLDNRLFESNVALEIISESKKKPPVATEQMDKEHSDVSVTPEIGSNPIEKPALTTEGTDYHQGLSKPDYKDDKADEESKHFLDNKHCESNIAPESSPGPKKKSCIETEPMSDSIGARLRQRRGKGYGHDKLEPVDMNEEATDAKQAVKSVISGSEAKANMNCSGSASPQVDSIGGRLRLRKRT